MDSSEAVRVREEILALKPDWQKQGIAILACPSAAAVYSQGCVDTSADAATLAAAAVAKVEAERDEARRAILAFGNNPAGFDWAILSRLEALEATTAKDGEIAELQVAFNCSSRLAESRLTEVIALRTACEAAKDGSLLEMWKQYAGYCRESAKDNQGDPGDFESYRCRMASAASYEAI